LFRKPVSTFRDHALLAHDARNAARLVPRACDPVLEITARTRTDVALPHIGPGPASVIRLARRLACGADGIGRDIQIAIVPAEPVDGIFHRSLARLDHTRAADTGDAAFVL